MVLQDSDEMKVSLISGSAIIEAAKIAHYRSVSLIKPYATNKHDSGLKDDRIAAKFASIRLA